MNRLILTAAFAAACTVMSSAPAIGAAARNYDCSKPGNANKAACKGAAAKPAATAKPPAAKAAPKVAAATKTTTTRTYDCTKAGNANKAQCKRSTTVASTTTTKTAPAAAPAKPSMFQRMKNAMGGSSAAPAKPVATPAAAPAPRKAAPAAASAEDKNPAGAIAQCKDGTYSHAKNRTGACSRHGGVAKWS